MKTYTNHNLGARGINTTDGTVWIEPGQSVELDPQTIVGDLPDLGRKPSGKAGEGADVVSALTAKVTDLEKQVEALTKERNAATKEKADLEKQVEALTKPKA